MPVSDKVNFEILLAFYDESVTTSSQGDWEVCKKNGRRESISFQWNSFVQISQM